eukprot:gene30275-35263_t
MKLLPESLQQEAATAAAVAGWVLWYIDTQALPSLLREHKFHAVWAAASKRYHESIWKFNYAADRELRYSAISKNLVLEHINHTKPKAVEEHAEAMISANKKVFDAFSPASKRLLIWQTKPSLV